MQKVRPWIPFPDYRDHLIIAQRLASINPDIEVKRAHFSQTLAFSLLLSLGDPNIERTEKLRAALHLAQLSARVLLRRNILESIIDPGTMLRDEDIERLEQAVQVYWIVAQTANTMRLMPDFNPVLQWVIAQAVIKPHVTDDNRFYPPYRSKRLATAMQKRYGAREMFLTKLWDSRFPGWMHSPATHHRLDKGDETAKTEEDQA